MPLLLGLTGLLCAGKNAAAAILEEEGFLVLDVDRLGHAALEEGRDAVAARFGQAVLGPDGRVDRKALGRLVFRDRRALADLEAIVHPLANRMAEDWASANAGRDRCVNAALLHRMPMVSRLDAVLLLTAPPWLRLFRSLRRDRLGLAETLRRMARQKSFPAALRAGGRPILRLDNGGSREALRTRVRVALESLRKT